VITILFSVLPLRRIFYQRFAIFHAELRVKQNASFGPETSVEETAKMPFPAGYRYQWLTARQKQP
jgi:hypothetical protein